MKKIILLILIAAAVLGIFIISRHDQNDTGTEKIILNENQLEPYLNIKGVKVASKGSDDIRLPYKFCGNFKIYADEMKNSGYDLESHKGEKVKRYTYKVDNSNGSDVIAEILLTSDNELIAAALIEQKTDGFIKGI